MKPALSPIVTSTLPSRAASASTSSTTDGSVTTVRTTSTSFMTGAGLKKCIPMTLLGRPVTTESSVTDRLEVLVARMVSGGQILSSWEKTSALSSMRSGTASITSSAPARSSSEVVKRIRSKICVAVGGVELAAADRPVGGLLDVAAAAGHRLVVDLHGGDRQARSREHLGDAGTHGAQPHDADLVQFSGHAATPPGQGSRAVSHCARSAARRGYRPVTTGRPGRAPASTLGDWRPLGEADTSRAAGTGQGGDSTSRARPVAERSSIRSVAAVRVRRLPGQQHRGVPGLRRGPCSA